MRRRGEPGGPTRPLAILEAQAAGVPVVATDLPGCREALGRDGGILVAPGDIEALGAAIAGLIGDVERREALAAAGRRRWAEHFQADEFLERYLGQLGAVLAGPLERVGHGPGG